MLEVVKSSPQQHGADDDGAGPGERAESPVQHQAVPHQSVTRPGARWAAAAGIAAAAGGLAAEELLAGFASPSLSPLTAVGGAVIDAVPPGVKDWAITLFGTADKAALLAGMGLAIAALAAVAGVLELRRRWAGASVMGIFGLAGLAAVLTRAQATPLAPMLPVLAAAAAVVLLRFLVRRLQSWEGSAPGKAGPGGTAGSRRGFLQALAATSAASALGGVLAGFWRGAAIAATEAGHGSPCRPLRPRHRPFRRPQRRAYPGCRRWSPPTLVSTGSTLPWLFLRSTRRPGS